VGGPGRDIWDADASDTVRGVERRIQCFAE
jgi:hypothetical protein